jgi:hypothetical protein
MAQEIANRWQRPCALPHSCNETLAIAVDEPAAASPTCSTSRTTAGVRRNAPPCRGSFPACRWGMRRKRSARHAAHRCGCPTSSRSGRSLHRRALYAVRCFPIVASALLMLLSSPLRPLHLRVVPNHSLLYRAPMGSPSSTVIHAHQVSWCCRTDAAHCARPTHGCLTLTLVEWSDRFSLLCMPMPGERLACFFDWRTLPARRGASKRSRLTDHGPLPQPPRSPIQPRPSVFDPPLNPCWFLHAIENSTP